MLPLEMLQLATTVWAMLRTVFMESVRLSGIEGGGGSGCGERTE
jgi:hypothetical protein